MSELITYPNGLRVVVENMSCIHSVVAGIWIKAGSVYESERENGIAHFIEHVTFKGTKSKSARDISLAFESVGAITNAFTSREHTCYYFKSVDTKAEYCFDTLCDILINSVFPKDEIERERNVVIQELNMSEDDGDGLCYDLLQEILYDGHPLAQTILGSAANIERFSNVDINRFRDRLYCPQNTVISFAGNITAEKADELVRKYFLPYYGGSCKVLQNIERFSNTRGGYKIKPKDFEQSSIFTGFSSVSCRDLDFTTQSVMDIILGNGMSSRMFQRLREKMGLVYSIYTAPMATSFNGAYSVCMNVNPKDAKTALDAVFDELNILMQKGITDAEIDKAKTQLKVNALFSMENPLNIMMAMGRWLIMADRVYNINDTLTRIEAVTKSDTEKFAKNLFSRPVFCAYVGKESDINFDNYIKIN